jgi:flagellar motor switch protein FliG
MGAEEIQQIVTTMADLNHVTADSVDSVLRDFTASFQIQTAFGLESEEYIRDMLTEAVGPEKASGIISRVLMGRNSKGIDQLKRMDSRAIVDMIRQEHPQIITIVLAMLESDHAAELLAYLPAEMRADIVMRIATLDGVQPSALKELNSIIEKQLIGSANVKSSSVGGIDRAANILNFLESSVESALLEEVANNDPELSRKILDKMFVFDNLIDVDDRSIQTLLREIPSDSLLLALRGADDGMKDKFFRNMSKRAADILRDDLEASPPVKLSKVEQAQKDILTVARRLAESGEMTLRGGDSEQLV